MPVSKRDSVDTRVWTLEGDPPRVHSGPAIFPGTQVRVVPDARDDGIYDLRKCADLNNDAGAQIKADPWEEIATRLQAEKIALLDENERLSEERDEADRQWRFENERGFEHRAEIERLREQHERDLIQVAEAHEARRKAASEIERLRTRLDEVERDAAQKAREWGYSMEREERLLGALRYLAYGDLGSAAALWDAARNAIAAHIRSIQENASSARSYGA